MLARTSVAANPALPPSELEKKLAAFSYRGSASRIVFGRGSIERIAEEVRKLGCVRPLLLAGPRRSQLTEEIVQRLDGLVAGVFSGAVMHTPVEVTETAMTAYRQLEADGVISVGGGTTIGLGKAIAFRNDAPQLVVPTTYAGSEVTPVLGQTENGIKTTVRDQRILPESVLYDPDLTLGLPISTSVTSGLNAISHAVEALYAADRNPISSLMAMEGVRSLHRALPAIKSSPGDYVARSDALYGAWLCGTVLGTVGMSLHHKLCHVLGGSFGLPHAETHAILLPYVVRYNAKAAHAELQPLSALFGDDVAGGIQEFSRSLGAPPSLAKIGMQRRDLDAAAEIALRNAYANPRPLELGPVRDLLQDAWEGTELTVESH